MAGFHVYESPAPEATPEVSSCRSRPGDEPNDHTGHMPCDGCEYGDRWFQTRREAEQFAGI